jgi:hypothetical protein
MKLRVYVTEASLVAQVIRMDQHYALEALHFFAPLIS